MEAQRVAEREFYVKLLSEEECLCGRTKKRGLAFCGWCYRALPAEHKMALYRKLGHGFEEACEEAVAWLQLYHW